jgi:hypothetical protein
MNSLGRFMRLSRFKKLMLEAVAFSLTPAQITILRTEFNAIDTDRWDTGEGRGGDKREKGREEKRREGFKEEGEDVTHYAYFLLHQTSSSFHFGIYQR